MENKLRLGFEKGDGKKKKKRRDDIVGDDQLNIIDNITCYFRSIVNNAWKTCCPKFFLKRKKKQKCCFPTYHDY
jgi:hypothetical protein